MEAGGGENVLHGLLVSLPLGIRSSISARVVPAHRGPLLLLGTCRESAVAEAEGLSLLLCLDAARPRSLFGFLGFLTGTSRVASTACGFFRHVLGNYPRPAADHWRSRAAALRVNTMALFPLKTSGDLQRL